MVWTSAVDRLLAVELAWGAAAATPWLLSGGELDEGEEGEEDCCALPPFGKTCCLFATTVLLILPCPFAGWWWSIPAINERRPRS